MYGIFAYFYQKQYTKINASSVCQVRCVRIFQVGYELILVGRWSGVNPVVFWKTTFFFLCIQEISNGRTHRFRTPKKPENLRARSQLTERGLFTWVPFNFLMDCKLSTKISFFLFVCFACLFASYQHFLCFFFVGLGPSGLDSDWIASWKWLLLKGAPLEPQTTNQPKSIKPPINH